MKKIKHDMQNDLHTLAGVISILELTKQADDNLIAILRRTSDKLAARVDALFEEAA